MRTPIVTGLTGCSTRSFVSPLRRRLGPKHRSRQILSQSISQSISQPLACAPIIVCWVPLGELLYPFGQPQKIQNWAPSLANAPPNPPDSCWGGEKAPALPPTPPPAPTQCAVQPHQQAGVLCQVAVLPAAATAAGPSSQVRSHFGPRAWLVGV